MKDLYPTLNQLLRAPAKAFLLPLLILLAGSMPGMANDHHATYSVKPTITTVSPLSGPVGSTVTITGTDFNTTPGSNIVYFGAVKATVVTASATTLTVTVPAGATYAPVSVTTDGGYAQNNVPFALTFTGGNLLYPNTLDTVKNFSTAGVSLTGIRCADIDGDGKPDALAVNTLGVDNNNGVNALLVYRNTTTAATTTFATPVYFSATGGGTGVYGLTTADIDGDGKADIIATFRDNIYVFRNASTPGSISFDAPVTIATSYLSYNTTIIADMDNDGKQDIVFSPVNNQIHIARNTSTPGSISLAASTLLYSVAGGLQAFAASDLDGDNYPELMISSSWGGTDFSVYKNTTSGGTLSFVSGFNFIPTGNQTKIRIGDMDLDGKPDIMLFASRTYYAIRNTTTAGTLSFAVSANINMNPYVTHEKIDLNDMNGDGKPELIIASSTTNTLYISRNISTSGNISIETAPTAFAGNARFSSSAFCDLNSDSKADFLTIRSNSGIYNLALYRNSIGKPYIASTSTDSAATGTEVTITGDYLNNATGVSFGGVPASSFTIVSPNTLKATVGAGASGSLIITSSLGAVAKPGFLYIVGPIVSSFSPTTAKLGTSITITGTNFTNVSAVTFGGLPAASYTVNSTTQITAIVGQGLTGSVSVTNPSATGSLAGFTYIGPPVITSVSPSNGAAGSSVTLTGTDFGNTIGDNKVFFGPVPATITAASPTSLTVQVPAGAAYRPISVTANNFTGQSALPFNVTFTGADSLFSSSFTKTLDLAATSTTITVSADFDGDGKTDIVSGTSAGPLLLYTNTTTGGALSFASGTQASSGSLKWLSVADLNGDGKQDIVAIKHGSSANPMIIFRNTSTPGTISFTVDLTVGYPASSPASLILTDIDSDGKPDIIAVNETTANITVLRNTGANGSFSFAPVQQFAFQNVNARGTRLVAAQLTDDKKPDLAILTNLGLSTFVNNSTPGNLQFGTEQVTTAGATNRSIATGDVNSDGLPDLVISYITSGNLYKVGVLTSAQAAGSFTLSPITELASVRDPLDILLEDLTGDAKPEIVVVNKNNNLATAYRNAFNGGAVAFEPYDAFPVGTDPLTVTTADFDGDGRPDICTTNRGSNTLSILQYLAAAPTLSNISPKTGGPGTAVTLTGTNLVGISAVAFGGVPAASFTVVNPTTIIAVAGEAADGVVTVTTPGSILSISGFTFVKPSITSFSPAYGPAGTVVTINGLNFSSNPDSNTVYFGAVKATITSTSTTSLTVLAPAGATWQPISVTCYKATGYSTQPFILAYGGNATLDSASFSARVNLRVNTPAYGVAIGDFNGDGKPDLVCSHEAISVYINTGTTGNPSYAAPINLTGYGDVAVADFNGDRKLDIVARNYGEVNVFVNTTTGGTVSFSNVVFEAPLTITRLAVGDFDGDSRPDIALAGEYTNNITILRNTSTYQKLNFSPLGVNPIAPLGQNTQDIIAADFNGDGKAELVVTDYNSVQAVVYKNVSVNSITFVNYPLPLYGYSLACVAGDLDADGKPDLVISKLKQNSRTGFSIFKNTSTGGDITFSPGGDYETDYEAYGLAMTDITGDSKPEVIAANGTFNAKVSIFQNTSTGAGLTLAPAVNYATGNEPLRVLAGDLNGDGKPDVVTAQGSSNYSPAGLYILYSLLPDAPPALTGGGGQAATMTMKAGPNPFVSSITVKLDSAVSSKSKLLLIDVNGNILHSQQYDALPAGSSINMTKTGLKPGFYYLVLQTTKGRSILRVIKQ